MTYSEQIDHLIKDHALVIADAAKAEDILRSVNYYRLSAYGIGLTPPNDKDHYLPGVSIEQLYHLYQFDVQLRAILIPAIEHLEVKLRAQISYLLAIKYGSEGYRNPTNFKGRTTRYGVNIHTHTMELLDKEIIRQKALPFVKHHKEKYDGHFPIWVATELFTFGMLSSLYSIMRDDDRKEIAAEYQLKSANYLSSWILCLVELRNMCAHYTRLYNMPFAQAPYLFKENREYQCNKLFPAVLVIKRMLGVDNPVWNTCFLNLQKLVSETGDLQPSFMGFPDDWVAVLATDYRQKSTGKPKA